MKSFGFKRRHGEARGDALFARLGVAARDLGERGRRAVEALMADLERLQAENSELHRRLAEVETLADRDPLAPVLNRRAFLRELERIVSFVERYAARGAVVFVDLDGFKAMNDTFGHAVGDAALQHVAQLLLLQTRDSDVVGRIGGDEFAIVLSNAGPEEARAKAQILARMLAETPFTYDRRSHVVRASFGVHAFSGIAGPCERAEALLARADEAMYAAKQAAKLSAGRLSQGFRAAG